MTDKKPESLDIVENYTISPTELSQLYRCPRSYYYKYIKRIKKPRNYYMIRGIALHEALEHYYENKLMLNKSPHNSELIDIYVNSLETGNKAQAIDWQESSKDIEIKNGIAAIPKYIESVGRKVDPLWVEKEFDISYNGKILGIKGRFDLVDRSLVLRDTKSKNKPVYSIDSYVDLQMSCYALALFKMIKKGVSNPYGAQALSSVSNIKIYIDYVIMSKDTPSIKTIELNKNKAQLLVFANNSESSIKFIQMGRNSKDQLTFFYPNPNAYPWKGGCQEWCDYYNECSKES